MAFPEGLTLITVSGQVAGLPDGMPAHVTVSWPWMTSSTGAFLAAGQVLAPVDGAGEFSLEVPATNDPAWSPTGFTLRVTVVRGVRVTRGTMLLPYDGGPVELADVFNPDDATEPGQTYALVGHTHPGGGEGGPIAISDVTGLTLALAGKSSTGHTHPISDVTNLQTALDGRATDSELAALDVRVVALEEAPGGGGGSTLVVRRATVTSGNLTMASSGAWIAVAGGPSLVLPAAVGDYVQFDFPSLLGSFSTNFIDMAVLVGGTIVRCLSSGTATPATEGAPGFYGDQSFDRTPPVFEFEVESGDRSGGNVTVQLITKGSGGGSIFASADYPLRWRAMNYGPADVA